MQLHRSCNIGVWQQYQQQQQMNSSKRAMGVPGRPQPKHRSHIAAAAVKSTGAVVAADQLLKLQGIQSKAAGALLAAMCGNALGAQVEPEKHYRLSRMFPDGLQDMTWSFDISANPLPAGHVTGDYTIMTAVGQSVVRCKTADPLDMCDAMAASYDATAPEQWYSPYSRLMLEGLAAGSNPFLLAKHAEGYLSSTASRASNTATHRPARQLHGMTDFSALTRVIPVAVAYRAAPLHVLREAAEAAVLLTHPSETAADAAAVLAAAIAWCMRSEPSSAGPSQLLDHLLADVASTAGMKDMLGLLQDRLPPLADLGSIDSWSQFWRSRSWNEVTAVANLITKQNLAVEATQATALALWVLLVSWQHPQQAVMLAASLGGYAATTGTLVGSMAGALHGCDWVQQAWWDNLQDEPQAVEEQQQQEEEGEQQPPEEGEQRAPAAAAAAPAGQQEAGSGQQQQQQQEVDEEELGWLLRPVSKHSVVELAQRLAELECMEVAPLL